jgi:ADP-ribose pyrophosphatase YjhB (NUDIX family)
VLFVRHAYGGRSWALPGGALEPRESVSEAIVRECREEVGLEVSQTRVTGVYTKLDGPELVVVFKCRVDQGEPIPGPEVSECRFFPVEQPPPGLKTSVLSRLADALSESAPVCRLEP